MGSVTGVWKDHFPSPVPRRVGPYLLGLRRDAVRMACLGPWAVLPSGRGGGGPGSQSRCQGCPLNTCPERPAGRRWARRSGV